MRHVGDPLLGVVDGLDDRGGELLKRLGEGMLFRCCFTAGCSCLGIGRDGSVRVKTSDGSIALLQNPVALLKHGSNILDELLFVELFLGSAVCFLDALVIPLVGSPR